MWKNIYRSFVVGYFSLNATLEETVAWAHTIYAEIVAKNKELAIAKQKESKWISKYLRGRPKKYKQQRSNMCIDDM